MFSSFEGAIANPSLQISGDGEVYKPPSPCGAQGELSSEMKELDRTKLGLLGDYQHALRSVLPEADDAQAKPPSCGREGGRVG